MIFECIKLENTEKHKLDSLIAELKEIEKKLSEVKNLETRRLELRGDNWGRSSGEIVRARIAYAESLNPIFKEEHGFHKRKRIIKIDEKWISIKTDGSDAEYITRYKIENGWRERSRSGYDSISMGDVALALKIWHDHVSSKSEV